MQRICNPRQTGRPEVLPVRVFRGISGGSGSEPGEGNGKNIPC